jgi:hypothetical protein
LALETHAVRIPFALALCATALAAWPAFPQELELEPVAQGSTEPAPTEPDPIQHEPIQHEPIEPKPGELDDPPEEPAAADAPGTDAEHVDGAETPATDVETLEALEVDVELLGPPSAAPLAAESTPGIGNEDVVEMVRAEFSESTIVAAIAANPTRFDVSPRALLALKRERVPERVMEAMLEAASQKRQAAAAPTLLEATEASAAEIAARETRAEQAAPEAVAAASAQMSPETLAALSRVIERLAEQPAAAADQAADDAAQTPKAAPADPRVPRAWVVDGDRNTQLPPAIAQVAVTDAKRNGQAVKTLQTLAGKALAFANPALGFAGELGGLFNGGGSKPVTAVWALPGSAASRGQSASAEFEIEFGNIPGVNPDEYLPALIRLVPTGDNYRLVGAAKMSAEAGGTPVDAIVEEPVEANLTPLGRGRYRIAFAAPVADGEYALVLRPIVVQERRRARRRDNETSLGDLWGGGASQILYITWDFSVRS